MVFLQVSAYLFTVLAYCPELSSAQPFERDPLDVDSRHRLPPQLNRRIDSAALRRALQRAAPTFEQAAFLAHEIENRMLERAALMRLDPTRILVVDGRSGGGARRLRRTYPRSRTVLLDPAVGMAHQAKGRGWQRRQHFCLGWSTTLPFSAHAFQVIWSTLGLQWVEELEAPFHEFRRTLDPGGVVIFSSLGPDTLYELRSALDTVFGERAPDMPLFADMHDVGDALTQAGFEGVVMENEVFKVTYPDLRTLLHDGRTTGSGAVLDNRFRGLITPRRLRALEEHLPKEDGRIVVHFEVVYGHAWRSEAGGVPTDKTGVARIGVGEIQRGR